MAEPERRVAADNRRARHDYFIDEHFEAGLMLQGTEVKSLRTGKANLSDSMPASRRGNSSSSTLISRNTPAATGSTTSRAGRGSSCSTSAKSTSCWPR